MGVWCLSPNLLLYWAVVMSWPLVSRRGRLLRRRWNVPESALAWPPWAWVLLGVMVASWAEIMVAVEVLVVELGVVVVFVVIGDDWDK